MPSGPRSFLPPERPPAAPPVTRRQLLVGGGIGVGLVVAWGLWPRHYRPNLPAAAGEHVLNGYLKIGEDGHVTVAVGQAEMGQGSWTSLPQIVADELGADWRTIAVEPAPIGPLFANTLLLEEAAAADAPGLLSRAARWAGGETAARTAFVMTAGSSSIRAFEGRLREAGASARVLLCMAAAQGFGADWRALDTEAGFVTHGDDKRRFGELAAAAAGFTPPKDLPLRVPGEGGVSGRPVPRIDLPAKVDGSAQFAGDVRLPDMVYAAVRMGLQGDTRFAGADERAAKAAPGVIALLKNPRWVAAVATTWWGADRALELARPRFEGNALPDDAAVTRALQVALAGEAQVVAEAGDMAARPGRIEATYATPFAPHAVLEPLTATARFAGGRLEVWAPTQAPGLARAAAARAAGLPEADVSLYPTLVGGGFGRKLEVDAIVQAAAIAVLVKRPVQLTWPRPQETAHDRFGPPAQARMSAALGAGGMIASWSARIATPAAEAAYRARLMDGPAFDGAGAGAAAAIAGAVPPYAIPNLLVEHAAAELPVATGIARAGGHGPACFFTESLMDELAARANQDPLTFRVRHLGGNPRLARCLQRVGAAGGWDGGTGGQGLAVHSAFGSHVAVLAEAEREGAAIRVRRIVLAADCGRLIHPDIVRGQLEGAALWGLHLATGRAIGFARGVATQRSFADMGLPRLADTPEIEVHLMESRADPGGAAELGVAPIAPAIANALFAATGERLRTLPLGTRA